MNTDTTHTARTGLRMLLRPWRIAGLAAPVTALTLAMAACGGTASPGVAQLAGASPTPSPSSSSSGDKAGSALAFSQCMRQHGIANFPDPGSRGNLTITGGPGTGLDPGSPQFQAAQNACKSLLPNGGQPDPAQAAAFQQAALQFSRCMRAHGIADFPDPQFSNGGAGLSLSLPASISKNSPQFQAAQQACQSLLPQPGPGQATTGGPGGGSGSGQVEGGK